VATPSAAPTASAVPTATPAASATVAPSAAPLPPLPSARHRKQSAGVRHDAKMLKGAVYCATLGKGGR